MDLKQLASLLVAMGCPPETSADMAAQLDKRARQLAEQKGRDHDEALSHLVNLMKQGWAAQEKEFEFTIYDLRLTRTAGNDGDIRGHA